MTTNTKPTNSDGPDTPRIRPAKSTTKSTRILGAIHTLIQRVASGFTLDRGIDAYCIMVLILSVILLIQGAVQWMH
jgi:hypothetical protein